MPQPTIVVGQERLLRKLNEIPQASRDLLERAGGFAQDRASDFAKPHEADRGTLAQNIEFSIDQGPVPLEARIFPNRRIAGIAFTVEHGRRPGKRPSAQAIGRWARRHGISRNPFALAREIGRRGTKGVFMFERAAEATQQRMGEFVQETVRRIESMWGR